MNETYRNPDVILRSIRNNEQNQNRGRLKIFFGYAAGVGKTYAMLKAAHNAKEHGIDVVIGYVEPHARPATQEMTKGLEALPLKTVEQGEIIVNELDIDAVLSRRPQLVLIDELAHTNADVLRHKKRYQDIEEILKNGIDVYTTVNVQHLESLNDTVASITGVLVRERIPDSVFDNASQVELVDIEPSDLITRMNEGNIYKKEQAQRAQKNFFTQENLTALREIALRRCADRVNRIAENDRIKNNGEYHTDEHILVCLSSAPSNAKIIRTASRMASAFRCKFTALFVETPNFASMSKDDKNRLRENIRLASELGASIETVYGEDVPYQIAEFARISGISKIVIGRSNAKFHRFFGKPTFTERLIAIAPNLDIHIIPDANIKTKYREKKVHHPVTVSVSDVLKCIGVLLIATVIGLCFFSLGLTDVNIISAYFIGVLVISVITKKRLYGIISAAASVLMFNFFFTEPRFTFNVYDKDYLLTFAVMFAVAFIASSLASRLKKQAKQSSQAAYRIKILFDLNQYLQKADNEEEIMSSTANQLIKLLDRDVVIYPVENSELKKPYVFKIGEDDTELINDNEKSVATWVMKNNKHAGATTNTLGSSKCLYLSIRINDKVYGVVGVHIDTIPLDSFENSILLSILGECALSLQNLANAKEKEAAKILAENEQLRANLLRSISHDLRTPLTSISGNASNLLSNGDSFDSDTKQQIYTDIYDDSMWLINLVENLLSITRIEDGRLQMNMATELVSEVIEEALRHTDRKTQEHKLKVYCEDEFLLAKMDARLIVQVIINIINNAVKYTPQGSEICVKAVKKDNYAQISIADNGNGIADENKQKVFDMFYTGANKIADSRRSIGLGLSLCKAIITAHGGEIWVSDNTPKGAVFTFTLPLGEVNIHE